MGMFPRAIWASFSFRNYVLGIVHFNIVFGVLFRFAFGSEKYHREEWPMTMKWIVSSARRLMTCITRGDNFNHTICQIQLPSNRSRLFH